MTIACPACVAVPAADDLVLDRAVILHLPDIHCAGCIATVESALAALPGVRRARVNLSLRRVAIEGAGLDAGALIDALARAGHRARELDSGLLSGTGSEMRDLLMRTGVAGFAMMNVMLLSVAVWSGADASTARMLHLVSALITVPAVAYAARPFFVSAARALRSGRLNMDVPISVAILLATGVSFGGALAGSERAGWFDAALALTFFLLIGRCLDQAGRKAARSAAAELAALDFPQALLLKDGRAQVVHAESLKPGDLIEMRPGDRIPADGVVESGSSDLDRSALTGESRPIPVATGAEVAAGEINLSGPLTIRVLRAGRDTALARLTDLVAMAETQRSRWSGIADMAARIYAPLVHLLGFSALIFWWAMTGDGWRSLDIAISVLVITCPCALGLAVPAVSTVATGRLFRRGLLVKSPTALERLAAVDLVAFDKTGTLTTGAAQLSGWPDDADLRLAAGLADASSHPYSRAIVAAAKARGLASIQVDDRIEIPGIGVEGKIGQRTVRLGHPGALGLEGEGVAMTRDGSAAVRFTFAETLNTQAERLTQDLRAAGFHLAILSGDGPESVARVASHLSIDDANARLTPEDKAAWLAARAAEGHRVLMVGDGLNDTAALASAHAALAPATALEAARSLADVVLIANDFCRITELLSVSRQSRSRMRQNIAIAAAYNLVAIPVALAGFASPLIAALAMSLSSLTVTMNSIRGWR